MATFAELRSLKEEKKALLEIASEFNAQLQRLKIEELALMSMVKLQDEETSGLQNKNVQEDNKEQRECGLETLDLSVSNLKDINNEEEEEEDSEEEEENDQLTMFIEDLTKRAGKGNG